MPRIYCDPEVCRGEPCVEGTRISIFVLKDYYEMNGHDLEVVKKDYPQLSEEDIKYAIFMAYQFGSPAVFYYTKFWKHKDFW